MIKILIADDSVFIRKILTTILEKDPLLKVIGNAKNGEEAVALCKELNPDVMTLDVDMPKLNGLEVLERIMPTNPLPVLMVSSLTSEGAETTLKALELGALDFIPKLSKSGGLNVFNIESDLIEKVKAVAHRKAIMQRNLKNKTLLNNNPSRSTLLSGTGSSYQPTHVSSLASVTRNTSRPTKDVVAIGVSTGGPPAVQKILSGFEADFPAPILIAQHMPASFTGPFAARLNNICKIQVKEAEHGERPRPGWAYVSPGGKHLSLEGRMGSLTLSVREEPKDALYKPSANVLMESVSLLGRRALGVILTGMGSDGMEGMKILKQKGGRVLAQNEASCVVYGMPKAVVDANLADEVVDIENMSVAILNNIYQ
ncbi:protein-glutamate methylesterase/protein-glutamine glutaminase [Desulfovibrio litoralis]|uniref:Protein-glutamate methylesterase/protein-glutamine glutaminase n=1 Tax=Desulfovibrio litoralis DSM 11393 TaxID=1121455 RepID=A0A1M7RT64_9BACT|nr:chemotaxis response regulator protein-glutamate methylesterase [Desulfovibrio litoralis]SHN49288.1 two-component system, chemotaxis family, response regulator CheB [Desulfovibrio litoralis DSM 11393]